MKRAILVFGAMGLVGCVVSLVTALRGVPEASEPV